MAKFALNAQLHIGDTIKGNKSLVDNSLFLRPLFPNIKMKQQPHSNWISGYELRRICQLLACWTYGFTVGMRSLSTPTEWSKGTRY